MSVHSRGYRKRTFTSVRTFSVRDFTSPVAMTTAEGSSYFAGLRRRGTRTVASPSITSSSPT